MDDEVRDAALHVIDHDSGEAITCPACGSETAAGAEHCSDCGLRVFHHEPDSES